MNRDEAISWLMDEYGEELKRLIFTYVKNRATTDDVFQEIMIIVYKKLDSFRGDSAFKTWLFRITVNKCKDYLKSPANRLILWKNNWFDSKDEETPESRLLLEEKKEELIESILSLPLKDREVLVLQYYKEMKIEEISDLLEMNASTVRTRISRAKAKLKNELKEGYLDG
ncbi:RNA polymerase subunit sigma-32 [Halalkalibacillus sediminis]|uniref:RNA polymerase subunit sigma-32 n=2 Tax=Halalkalibacillus sediminis TaxID=2018042 RepID=A0A2I0QTA1_9BACI|nr:RNA polymerase subunit sigma-32 [Halalkalibacillus sediminis]